MKLSVVCVTQGRPQAEPLLQELGELSLKLDAELIIGVNAPTVPVFFWDFTVMHLPQPVAIQEEVLNDVLNEASGDYILRLDDDERCSSAMITWLTSGAYVERDSWFFPRYALWPDVNHVVMTPPFFPDFQVRLTTRAKAGRPPKVHAASPWPSWRAPVYFEHHSSLVKTYAERQAITAHYETLVTGRRFEPKDANVVFPEDWKLQTVPVTDKLTAYAARFSYWREAGNVPPARLQDSLDEWVMSRV